HWCPTIDAPRYGRGSSAAVAAARSMASLMAPLIGSSERVARLRLSIGRLHNAHATTDLGAEERFFCHGAHTNQYNASAGFLTDRAVRPVKFGLAVGKAEQLCVGNDDLMEPVGACAGSAQRNPIAVGEELAQPGHLSAPSAERRI